MGILQPGKVFLRNPMKDQDSLKAINSLLPQILIQGDKVSFQQIITTVESKTLVQIHLTLIENGEEGGVTPHQEGGQDNATKLVKKRDRSRTRDTEEVTGVMDRRWRHPVK